ncbi:unnamed protein product [Phytomonas sp. EM1]|nr:unnamed protein product [Phytomonas sp. EM1]|eukprot:CCW60607.1 unnamed protein product [Phytomonas sp. isolate EM1]
MWEAVDGAAREVLWQTYICKDDEVGSRTLRRMVTARLRNCRVELLYDSGGNISGRTRLTEELKNCGGSVIAYRPFFSSALKYFLQGLDWRKSPGLRNHRKILLVDNEIGFCGGLNIGNEYCGLRLGGNNKFRDAHCAVYGPVVAHLREVYDDTKAPQTWKYGWARWRQIASNKLNRRIEVGKNAVETGILRPIQDGTRKATERGGIYFRQQVHKAERSTERMLRRIRWEKQWEKISKWVTWYNKRVSTLLNRMSDTTIPESPQKYEGSSGAHETQSKAESLSSSKLEGVQPDFILSENSRVDIASAGSPCPKTKFENPRVVNCSGEAGFLPDTKVVDDTNSVNGVKSTQSAAMQRRIAKERIQALHKATNIAHKRSWTGMLLDIPIADNEPVPEAEGYSSRHPAETQILSCNPRYHDYSIQYAYWQVLRKCHRRIWITTPYYLPSRKLFRALLHTASRGVDVRILAGSSRTTDPWFMWHASRYVTERLIRGGVRIYEYKGNQIMHAKTVVVDSVWSSIGSYNWDIMSDKNLEVCLCHLDAKMAREMETHFLEDLKLSEEVKLEDYQKRSLWLRFTSFFFYNLVYILQRIAFFSFADDDLEASLYSSKIKSKKLLGKKDNLKGEI